MFEMVTVSKHWLENIMDLHHSQIRNAQVGVVGTIIVLTLFLVFTSGLPIENQDPRPAAVVLFNGETQALEGGSWLEELQAYQERAFLSQLLQSRFRVNANRASNFAVWIQHASNQTGVPIEIMAALIATESSFRYKARSHAGAIGPAQVIPRFWEEQCNEDLADPQGNIACGAQVLALYRKSCDDWVCALQKYNVGPTGYTRPESRGAMDRYIAKIQTSLAAMDVSLVNGELRAGFSERLSHLTQR